MRYAQWKHNTYKNNSRKEHHWIQFCFHEIFYAYLHNGAILDAVIVNVDPAPANYTHKIKKMMMKNVYKCTHIYIVFQRI